MRSNSFLFIAIGVMLLLDIYIFQVFKTIINPLSVRGRLVAIILFWLLSVLSILFAAFIPYFQRHLPPGQFFYIAFTIVLGLFLAKVIAVAFFLIDDIRRGIQWFITRLAGKSKPSDALTNGDSISRSAFLSWLGFIAG